MAARLRAAATTAPDPAATTVLLLVVVGSIEMPVPNAIAEDQKSGSGGLTGFSSDLLTSGMPATS
jgi:hypothetical protein